jgi:hypothetical protein
MKSDLLKHEKELRGFIEAGDYEASDGGILIHRGIKMSGTYYDRILGVEDEFRVTPNLLPSQGIAFVLDVALGALDKAAGFYLAPFAGAVNPAANWTAANFTATASEITSGSEGYSNANRPTWTPGATVDGVIDNLASLATFNIVCTSTLNISGMALLTSNVKGGTSGYLISATRYGSVRVVNNGDAFQVGYKIELTDS